MHFYSSGIFWVSKDTRGAEYFDARLDCLFSSSLSSCSNKPKQTIYLLCFFTCQSFVWCTMIGADPEHLSSAEVSIHLRSCNSVKLVDEFDKKIRRNYSHEDNDGRNASAFVELHRTVCTPR